MYSYTATISRNYSTGPTVFQSMRGLPMTLTHWRQFVYDVEADMRGSFYPAQIIDVEIHYGGSQINSGESPEQDTAKITVLSRSALPEDPEESKFHYGLLRDRLFELARQYGQDAIELTAGELEIIAVSDISHTAVDDMTEMQFHAG